MGRLPPSLRVTATRTRDPHRSADRLILCPRLVPCSDVLRTVIEVLCHLRTDGEGPEMGFTGALLAEYLGYCVVIGIVAKLCVGLRVAVLQRETGGSNSESSMRGYLLRGSFKVRIIACLAVQLFCVFYTGMHAKVSPYYVYPLSRMANPVLTSPVLNPCKLTNTTYMQTYCERSPRIEGAEFSCELDGGWYTVRRPCQTLALTQDPEGQPEPEP